MNQGRSLRGGHCQWWAVATASGGHCQWQPLPVVAIASGGHYQWPPLPVAATALTCAIRSEAAPLVVVGALCTTSS